MEELQRRHQRGQFHRAQQVGIAGGAPALAALRLEKGLQQEHPTGRHAAPDIRHARAIKITEEENRIKNPELRPGLLQVQFQPGDPLAGALRSAARLGHAGPVAVDRHHRGAQLGRGPAVPARPAGQVEDPAARGNQVGMAPEPVAGALDVGGA